VKLRQIKKDIIPGSKEEITRRFGRANKVTDKTLIKQNNVRRQQKVTIERKDAAGQFRRHDNLNM